MRSKYKHSFALATVILMTMVYSDNAKTRVNFFDAFKQKHTKSSVPVQPKSEIDSVAVYRFKEQLETVHPRVIEAFRTENGVRYVFANGEIVERSGGTIAWRNNNPGCIRYSGNSIRMGAIGKANNFAIFPDEQTGMRAIRTLLLSDAYCNLNIIDAITKYAPPHENDTESYIRKLCRIVGVPRTMKICDLDAEQMDCVVNTIRRLEGWVPGEQTSNIPVKRNDVFAQTNFSALDGFRQRMICYAFENEK